MNLSDGDRLNAGSVLDLSSLDSRFSLHVTVVNTGPSKSMLAFVIRPHRIQRQQPLAAQSKPLQRGRQVSLSVGNLHEP